MSRVTIGVVGLLALLAGCGQKGALYLPEKTNTLIRAPAEPVAAPAPAPAPAPPAATETSGREKKPETTP